MALACYSELSAWLLLKETSQNKHGLLLILRKARASAGCVFHPLVCLTSPLEPICKVPAKQPWSPSPRGMTRWCRSLCPCTSSPQYTESKDWLHLHVCPSHGTSAAAWLAQAQGDEQTDYLCPSWLKLLAQLQRAFLTPYHIS